MNHEISRWLLKSNSWTRYNTYQFLLEEPEEEPEVNKAKREMLQEPLVQELIAKLLEWPGYTLKRHNDANHLIHKLAFVADLGIKRNDDPKIVAMVMVLFFARSPTLSIPAKPILVCICLLHLSFPGLF